MALAYGSRRTTEDADVVMADEIAAEISEAAARIAPEFSLPPGWLNQRAYEAGKIKRPQAERTVFISETLILEVPSAEHMLAMKIARLAGDADEGDAKLLLRKMQANYVDLEDLWSLLGGLLPVEQHAQARYNLDVLWESLHERP